MHPVSGGGKPECLHACFGTERNGCGRLLPFLFAGAFAGDTGWNGPPVCRFPGFKAVLSTKTFAGIENMLICIVDLVNNWTENKVLGGKKC